MPASTCFYILYIYNVGPLLVQVLDQGAVAARAEDQFALLVADGLVLLVDGDDIGVMLLFREGYLQSDAESTLVVVLHLGQLAAEGFLVLGRDGKVQVHSVVAVLGIEGALDDVLLQRRALHLAVAVEFQQRLGQAAVAQVLLFEQEVDDGRVVAAVQVLLDVELGAQHTCFQIVEESK